MMNDTSTALITPKATDELVVPTIHLNSPNKQETAGILRKACMETGFFYLDGHDIPLSFLDEVFKQSKEFFNLPPYEKVKLTDKLMNRGYTDFEEQALDIVAQKDRGDTKEGFYLGKHIPSNSDDYNPVKFRGPNIYPDETNSSLSQPFQFRNVMDSYHQKATQIGFQLVRLIALALNLPEYHFDKYFEFPIATLRLLHYTDEKSDPRKGIFSCGAHSDWGMLTLLLSDSNPGLQIYYQNKEWIPIAPKKGLFIVNLGDMLERWTNGLFRATIHRVVSNGENERYSIPFFYEPNYDTVIDCLDGCWSELNPKKYKSVTMGEFLTQKYEETHKEYEHNDIDTTNETVPNNQ